MAYLANIKHNSLKYLTAEDFYDYIIAEFGPFQVNSEKLAVQTKDYYANKKKQAGDSGVTTIPTAHTEADEPEAKEHDNGGKEDDKADNQEAGN